MRCFLILIILATVSAFTPEVRFNNSSYGVCTCEHNIVQNQDQVYEMLCINERASNAYCQYDIVGIIAQIHAAARIGLHEIIYTVYLNKDENVFTTDPITIALCMLNFEVERHMSNGPNQVDMKIKW